jgi:hypothetical protein
MDMAWRLGRDASCQACGPLGLQARLDELEQRRTQLASAIAAAPQPAPRLHPNLAELYRQKVANLQEALADPATRTEALNILQGLVERGKRPVNRAFRSAAALGDDRRHDDGDRSGVPFGVGGHQ